MGKHDYEDLGYKDFTGDIPKEEKGHLFERVALEYFVSLGFNVKHNVVLEGFSGAKHEVDILLESPDGRKGLVEVKNLSRPVSKEWVMKAYSVARDLGLDTIYVVSASGFTAGAQKIAEVLNVKLLDLDRMVEVLRLRRTTSRISSGFVRPKLGLKRVKSVASKLVFKRIVIPIERVTEISLIYLPFYLVKCVYSYYEEEGLIFKKKVKRSRDVAFIVDGIRGDVPVYRGGKIIFKNIKDLGSTEKDLLKILVRHPLSLNGALKALKLDKQELIEVIKNLQSRLLIIYDRSRDRIASLLPTLKEMEVFVESLKPIEYGMPRGHVNEPKVLPAAAQAIAKSIYELEPRETRILYLPVYKIRFEKKDGSYRYVYFAGWQTKFTPLMV